MKLVIQRVKNAAVTADGVLSGRIQNGLLALVGVVEGDTEAQAEYLAGKTARLRIFTDEDDKLNLSVQDVKECLRKQGIPVETGVFGAHMEIEMTAWGPITILMDTEQMGH